MTRLETNARRRRQRSARDFLFTALVAAATLVSLSSLAIALDAAAAPSTATR